MVRPGRVFALLVTTMALMPSLLGCGGSSDGRADTVPETQPTSTSSSQAGTTSSATLTKDQAKAALLTINDMPTGWTTDTDDSDDSPSGCGALDRLNKVQKGNPNQIFHTDANFTQDPQSGPFFSESISLDKPGTAHDALENIKAVLSNCREFTSPEGYHVTVSPLSFPSYGDDAFACQVTLHDVVFYARLLCVCNNSF